MYDQFITPVYCLDEENIRNLTENTTVKAAAKGCELQSSVLGNKVSPEAGKAGVYIFDPWNNAGVLDKVGYFGGFSTTIVGGLGAGAGVVAKSGLVKAGVTVGTSAMARGLYTLGATSNKGTDNNSNIKYKVDLAPSAGPSGTNLDSSYPAKSIIGEGDYDLFTAQDAIDLLNTYLILDGIVLYLLFSLIIVFIGIRIVDNKKSLYWIKALPTSNNIYVWLEKIIKVLVARHKK